MWNLTLDILGVGMVEFEEEQAGLCRGWKVTVMVTRLRWPAHAMVMVFVPGFVASLSSFLRQDRIEIEPIAHKYRICRTLRGLPICFGHLCRLKACGHSVKTFPKKASSY